MATMEQQGPEVRRIKDWCLLVACALLLCLVAGGAFLIADFYRINPLWIFASLISIVFFAGAREDYRKEFKSVRFVAFIVGWVVVNATVFILVLGLLGWLWLVPILLVEQFLFYMTAYWLFGIRPPSRRERQARVSNALQEQTRQTNKKPRTD